MGRYKRFAPSSAKEAAALKDQQRRARIQSRFDPGENWMAAKLDKTGSTWTRKAVIGFRLFDFWCHPLGIAVEIDDDDRDEQASARTDLSEYQDRGILVLHARGGNERDAAAVIEKIAKAEKWNTRRFNLGLKPISGLPDAEFPGGSPMGLIFS